VMRPNSDVAFILFTSIEECCRGAPTPFTSTRC
jgi:hypothetical protein